MVIIAREFAVTGLRQLAMEHGEVIPASVWGKVKTVAQVAMVLGADHRRGLAGLGRRARVGHDGDHRRLRRRLLLRLPLARAGAPGAARELSAPSSHSRSDTWCARVLARGDLAPHLAQQPEALGLHVVLVDRLQVLLAGGDEVARRSRKSSRSTTPRIISRTQSSTKRGRRWAFSTTAPSSERFISS